MPYPSNYYDKALEIINDRKAENSALESSRYQEITEKLPQVKDIFNTLCDTTGKLVNIILNAPADRKEQINRLKDENLSLQRELGLLLKKNGYPENYLDPIYTCDKCKDTGYENGLMCSCFKDELKKIASAELSKSLPLGLYCFESFDLSYYPDIPEKKAGGRSIRDIMSKNYEFCKDYAENFTVPAQSIMLIGATGLGKTHLSLSIAKVVIEKGYLVVYASALDLFRRIEQDHFGKTDEDVLETVKGCDLLILDDLGSEFSSPFYISCLYDILNTRMNYKRPIIVNTNLTLDELQRRYSDRILSRLSSTQYKHFFGNDIRNIKKNTRR